jgi:hypothetical protein
MSWIGARQLFDVRDWAGSSAVGTFAQSPQGIILDDRIRVFFSTRRPDDVTGKWISEVASVDFTPDFAAIIGEPRGGIIDRGTLGSFDEHGIFPFSPVRHQDAIWAYTTGWSRRRSVDVETGIGLAVSRDGGLTFDRVGLGPVLSSSLYEPFLVCDGFAVENSGGWRMYYLFGTAWQFDTNSNAVERTYKIGIATSADGLRWEPSHGCQSIPDRLGELEAQALPSVARIGDTYHMVFCYRDTIGFRTDPQRGYRLGHAVSSEGLSWTRDDEWVEFDRTDFDSDMRCYPNLLAVDDRVFLLYNGNDFGRLGFGIAEWTP